MTAVVKSLEQVNTDLQEQKDKVDDVDFKMITFSLAGKEYGVDIMNVKEIAKADKFTFVPNAASFVRGVYNLRGDIIPVIDLRTFFHLPNDPKPDGVENLLILHINDQVYGTIVDKIDKVVGINKESIQPPHPIFGDINIKYISGVVEKQGDLYIILDVVRIFTVSEEDKGKRTGVSTDTGEYYVPPPGTDQAQIQRAAADSAIGFIQESLEALRRFTVSVVNERWLHTRFSEWSAGKTGESLQLRSASEADEFLSTFTSPSTGEFWSEAYATAVNKMLPELSSTTINVWNIGCAKGYETYSFACILRSRYPDARIKIWANDNDIMSVSQAPNMTFELDEIPEYCRQFMVHAPSGYSFKPVIKDSIVFEYHDISHENTLPELDIILVRDVISFLPVSEQGRIVANFSEKLKNRGLVIMGRNEELTGALWHSIADDPVSAYLHNA
ncbi:MAG: chemotaxis protein CheW [Treponema sp.]|jgi:purine-binding chemotaxis protein CheW|nr:chemotaxis protein CheW [Treponema sp.]